jgi:hypothetical protein
MSAATSIALAALAKAGHVPTGGGTTQPWYWSPPLVGDFSQVMGNVDSPAISDDPGVGLIFEVTNPDAHDWRWAVKPVPSPAANWSVAARISCSTIDEAGDTIFGLALRRGTDDARLLIVGMTRAGEFVYQISEPGAAYGSVSTGRNLSRWNGFGDYWLKAEHVASTSKMIYSASADGKIWVPVVQVDDTDLFEALPDRIGLGTYFDRTSYPGGLSCAAWIEDF